MKKIKKYIKQGLPVLSVLLVLLLGSCKKNEGFNGPVSTDKTKPGVVTNIKVKNLNGAAYITYTFLIRQIYYTFRHNIILMERQFVKPNQVIIQTRFWWMVSLKVRTIQSHCGR